MDVLIMIKESGIVCYIDNCNTGAISKSMTSLCHALLVDVCNTFTAVSIS